jgi:hypothetical protein
MTSRYSRSKRVAQKTSRELNEADHSAEGRRSAFAHVSSSQARFTAWMVSLCLPTRIATPRAWAEGRNRLIKRSFLKDRAVAGFTDFIAVPEANRHCFINEQCCLGRRSMSTIWHSYGANTSKADITRSSGIAEARGTVTLVPMGRAPEPQKANPVLLDAWPSVVKSFPPVRLVCWRRQPSGADRSQGWSLLESESTFVSPAINPTCSNG